MYGQVDADNRLTTYEVLPLALAEERDGTGVFAGDIPLDKAGPFGYTVRVLPSNPLLANRRRTRPGRHRRPAVALRSFDWKDRSLPRADADRRRSRYVRTVSGPRRISNGWLTGAALSRGSTRSNRTERAGTLSSVPASTASADSGAPAHRRCR